MVDNQLQAKGFLVWGICALFFLYEFFLRTVVGTYQHPVMQDLELTSFQFSLLSTTIFLFIYGVMQLPAGFIVDRIGLKKSLLIGAVCCAVSAFAFANVYNYPLAVLCRMLMGFGAAFGFICLLISVNDWMPHKYRAIFIGLSQFIGTLGPMAAAGPLESISESAEINWRFMFLCLGCIGVVIAALVLFFVKNNHEKAGKYIVLSPPKGVKVSFLRLFSSTQPWYIAILSASLYFTVEYLSENEARAFLALKGISSQAAAYMITIAWVGYAIGCPLWGALADFFERKKIIMKFCAVLGLVAILMVIYLPGHKLLLQFAFLLLGLSASGQSVGFAVMAEQFKKQFVALGFGLNNAMITTTAAINAPVIGFFLDQKRETGLLSLQEYLSVFNSLIAISIIAVVISAFFIKETYSKSQAGFTILQSKPSTA